MEDVNWIYMMEKMQEIHLFSRTIIHRVTKEYELSGQYLEVLSQLLLHEEGITPMNLSKIMGVNKTIISRVIDYLNKEGYVIKTQDVRDKRSYSVTITNLGKQTMDKVYKNYLGPIYELRRKLGDEEFIRLMTYIENANKKMIKD